MDKSHYGFDVFALVLGMLLPLAFAPLNIYPLSILIPSILFWIIYDTPKKLAFRRGYLFGFGLFAVGASWIYIAISDFGFTSSPVAFLLTLTFVAFLGLFPALQSLLGVVLARGLPFGVAAFVFALCWLLFEWIRGWFMTGFPWLNLGYSHINTPLIGFAPVLGVYGLSLISLFISASLCSLWPVKKIATPLAAGVVLGLFVTGWSLTSYQWTEKTGEPIKVAIVQASLPQITKWDPEQIRHRMDVYAQMSEPLWGKYEIIMWPENAMTILWQDVPLLYKDKLQDRAVETNTALVIGVPYGDVDTKYYSSLIVLGKKPAVYHKRHLVPFGEYVPLPEFAKKLAGFFQLPMSGFSRGDKIQNGLEVAGHKMAPSICYEDAFGEELIDFLPEATVLINGSNNAWYGKSWAAHQHLQIARMRAIETQRQSIRSTTTGISALIDEYGQLMQSTNLHEQTILTGTVQPRQGATPYVRWGNWPVLVFMLIVFLALLVRVVQLRARRG